MKCTKKGHVLVLLGVFLWFVGGWVTERGADPWEEGGWVWGGWGEKGWGGVKPGGPRVRFLQGMDE